MFAAKNFFLAGGAAGITTDFLVIAGGGGGGGFGGAGAGGYRTSAGTSGGGASAESQLTLSYGTSYTVTVGAGGAGVIGGGSGASGSNSVFSSITSTGGGFGDIPVSFVHSLNVSAGTTYYVWVGANTLNFNQTSASFGPVKLTATLHQASGL